MGDYFRCTLKSIQTPGVYWMTKYYDPEENEYDELEQNIRREIKSLKRGYMKEEIEENEVVAVQHPTKRFYYFRALVKGIFQKSSKYIYKLFLIDHGTYVEVERSKIEIIVNPHYRNKDPAAFKVRLYGVAPVQPMDFDPSVGESGFKWQVSKNWMPAAMDFVKKQFANYQEVYIKSRKVIDQSIIADVYLKDESNGGVVSLADLLIDNEFGIENSPKKFVLSSSDSTSASLPSDLQELKEVQAKLDRVREWRMQHMGANSESLSELDEAWNNEYGNSEEQNGDDEEEMESPSKDLPDSASVKSSHRNLLKLLQNQKNKNCSSPDLENSFHNTESLKTASSPASVDSSNDPIQKLFKRLSLSRQSRLKTNGCDNVPYETEEQNEFCDVESRKSSIKIILKTPEDDTSINDENGFDFEPNMPIRQSVINPNSGLSKTIREKVKPKLKPEHTILPAGKNLPEQRKQGTETWPIESEKISSGDQMEMEPWVLSSEPLADSKNTFKDNHFVPEVAFNLEKLNFTTLLPLQRWAVPSIHRGVNVVMISPSKSGKTVAYVINVINSLLSEEDLEEIEVFALILCNSPKKADYVKELCLSLLNKESKSKMKVLSVENINDMKSAKCHVLITSPSIFVNFMKNSYKNLESLRYLIFDDADQMRHPDIIVENILKGIPYKRLKNQCCAILTGKEWTSEIGDIIHSLQKKFVYFATSSMEVAIFNDIKCSVYYEPDERMKAQLVLNRLRQDVDQYKIVILCRNIEEINLLSTYFTTIGRAALIIHEKCDKFLLKDDITSWSHQKKNCYRILLCTYSMMNKVPIKETHYLVYYCLPSSFEELEISLAYLNHTFRKCSESENFSKKETEKSHLLIFVDKSLNRFLPEIIDFAHRLGADIPAKVSKLRLECEKPPKLINTTAKPELVKKTPKITQVEHNKPPVAKLDDSVNKQHEIVTNDHALFCFNLLEVGKCEAENCSYRHYFLKDFDAPRLPTNGKITFKIVQVENPLSYLVRIVEHQDEATGEIKTMKDQSIEINVKLLNYFEDTRNRVVQTSIKLGDIVGVECGSDLFYRGQVVQITEKNSIGEVVEVKVRRLERGDTKVVKTDQIYKLPKEIRKYPPQVYHVCLSNLSRGNHDNDNDAMNFVKTLIKHQKCVWSGQILFTVNYSIWLNTFEVQSVDDLYIDELSIRDYFLEMNWVEENDDHLSTLYELFDQSGIEYKRVEAKEEKKKKKEVKKQIEPDWALFDDKFNRAVFLGAENSSLVFLQKSNMKKELEKLEAECQKKGEKLKKKSTTSSFRNGDYCLAYAKSKRRWRRARIESQISSGIDVFFVDYAEVEHVQQNDILPLPNNLLTQLPFQAIECTLIGIKHTPDCDIQLINEIYNFCDMGETELCAFVIHDNLRGQMVNGRKYDINLLNFSGKSLNKIIIDNSLAQSLRSERCFVRDFDEIDLENL